MNEVLDVAELFELELELPNDRIEASSKGLVGFESRYQRLHRDLRLLADPEELRAWSKKYHHKELAVCAAVADRYPLVIFAGDVGTGKTVTAEGACDRLAREARKEAMLFKLSTRVRGSGKVGQMAREGGADALALIAIDDEECHLGPPGVHDDITSASRNNTLPVFRNQSD